MSICEQKGHLLWKEAVDRGLPRDGALLIVDVAAQRLTLLVEGTERASYAISTSKHGLGNVEESYKTPTGWHEVRDRFGDGEPVGRVFFEREATERVIPENQWRAATGEDLIMTRILRLSGLEDGVNRGPGIDTYDRYVYIHGSNHEQALGQRPVSHGCIHVSNHELVDLYDRMKDISAWCWIG